jgi:hypothetical protein
MRQPPRIARGGRRAPRFGHDSGAFLHAPTVDPASVMFAFPHALLLRHREGAAVLVSYLLFLAGALPLFWALG